MISLVSFTDVFVRPRHAPSLITVPVVHMRLLPVTTTCVIVITMVTITTPETITHPITREQFYILLIPPHVSIQTLMCLPVIVLLDLPDVPFSVTITPIAQPTVIPITETVSTTLVTAATSTLFFFLSTFDLCFCPTHLLYKPTVDRYTTAFM